MNNKNITSITAEPGRQELFITREFDATRELVFRAFTELALLEQWMGGPDGMSTRYETFEPREGGSYRYISSMDGMEFAFRGVCHEMMAPERIIQTFEFEGLPEKGHVVLETMRFEELPGGRTRILGQSVFQSVADRDGMVQSGMEQGVTSSYNRLDELILKGLQSS